MNSGGVPEDGLPETFDEFVAQTYADDATMTELVRSVLGGAGEQIHELIRTGLAAALDESDVPTAVQRALSTLDSEWNKSAAEILGLPQEVVSELAATAPFDFQAIADAFIEGNAQALREMEDLAREVGAHVLRHLPTNWSQIRFGDAVTLALEFGIPVIGHPRAEAVAALAEAMDDPDGPYAVLDVYRASIVDDAGDVAAAAVAATDRTVAEHGRHLEEIVFALRHRQDLVALRAAASLIEVVLQQAAKSSVRMTTKQFREAFGGGESVARAGAEELCRRIALSAAVQTLAQFEPGVDPVPERLNRHAAIHTSDAAQYSSRNAVWAVVVLANLIALELSPPPEAHAVLPNGQPQARRT